MIDVGVLEAWKQVWCTEVPSKIKIFSWRVLLDRIPSIVQLVSRCTIHLSQDLVCASCSVEIESTFHFLFEFSFSKKVWEKVCALLGLEDMDILSCVGSFIAFRNMTSGKVKTTKVNLIWMALIRSLWLMRNALMFNNIITSIGDVVFNIKFLSWFWLVYGYKSRENFDFYA